MEYENWKRLTPRQIAKWPAADKGYLRPQQQVTISIDADLAKWLIENVVGRSSFTGDLEETIVTALRVMRGDLPPAALPLPNGSIKSGS
ncbi:hypothetical protein [Rhizorhapis sp. SPR117]|uniref:hypothetical protein n=1 Tax=Rhizorhapis sp. SPR117 TaxID=2912611 RepID=UPI001F296F05|nr:hypothetical protein [Rhizorhapis sp. SPR117]